MAEKIAGPTESIQGRGLIHNTSMMFVLNLIAVIGYVHVYVYVSV